MKYRPWLIVPLLLLLSDCHRIDTTASTTREVGEADDFFENACDTLFVLPREPGERIRRQRPDRELRAILREIDRNQIESTIRRLVSFGTRHTLSSQTDPVRGIGAATNW